MKRHSELSKGPQAKRPRSDDPNGASSDPFRMSLQRKASRICVDALDDSGFIKAKVHMKWPWLHERANVILEVMEDTKSKLFGVTFAGPCSRFFNAISLNLELGDILLLSLENASAESVAVCRPNDLPLKLTYEHGVRMKFLSKKTPPTTGMTVDFWADQAKKKAAPKARVGENAPLRRDWFSTPDPEADAEVNNEEPPPGTSDLKKTPPAALQSPTVTTMSPRTVEHPVTAELLRGHSGQPPAPPPKLNPGQMSKKAAKRARRSKEREAKKARKLDPLALPQAQEEVEEGRPRADTLRHGNLPGTSSGDAPNPAAPRNASPLPKPVPSAPQHPESASQSPPEAVQWKGGTPAHAGASQKASQTSEDIGSAELEAGCVVPGGLTYTPLSNLRADRKVVNVIGIVAAIAPLSKTQTQDWSRKVTLVDPFNIDPGDTTRGFVVTCFTKAQQENVPDVDVGNVIVLGRVTISEWRGTHNGTCASNKDWSWSIYEPKTGRVSHSKQRFLSAYNSPQEWHPVKQQYCLHLGNWWQEKVDARMQQKVGGDNISFSVPVNKTQRTHRLIQDASPEAPPSGYFDCTVEILHAHPSKTLNVYCVYVTDYTANENLPIVDGSWCPPALCNMVLKMEAWHDAAMYAETDMKQGDFFSLPNTRIKRDSSGYYEGSVTESCRFEKLDEDVLEESPHLAELLNRKSKWIEDTEAAGHDMFPHQGFSKAIPNKYFSCTVQLLSISAKEDCTYIYVTDYTARDDLAPVHIDRNLMRAIGVNRIVKMALFDEQRTVMENLKIGDYLSIKSVRLKPFRRGVDGNLAGHISGNERLICKLQHENTRNKDLVNLLQRKKEIEQDLEAKQLVVATTGAAMSGAGTSGAASLREHAAEPKALLQPWKTTSASKLVMSNETGTLLRPISIKKVLAYGRDPCHFRIIARVVDFWPKDPSNCVGLYCTHCKESVLAEDKDCPTCDSIVRSTFHFWLKLEDEHDDIMNVGVESACTLLSGLEAAKLREDEDTYHEFRKRLASVVGDLMDKDEAKGNENMPCHTPWLDITVLSGTSLSGVREYVFLDHTVLQDYV
ncbi:hypothetical protein EUX98_g8531 [Antrodiella citrinella]|uniref:Protection of telomeres protein 1 n=1 Tax=Antrodiella citrinella TaxID=2447956 RepID=A0A4S4M653_9APHY|nr:hypothetical protein EUX98_g8531 [Antrodiella citrinella]